VPPGEQGRELSPVRGGPAEAVHEDERRPAATDEIPHADALQIGETLR
jgi:hypothetical protein